MTIHHPSNSLRFANTDISPLSTQIAARATRPDRLHTHVLNGQAVIHATFRSGRGLCDHPITAEFKLPLHESPVPRSVDPCRSRVKVTRHEDAFYGEEVESEAKLTEEMVAGLVDALEDHFGYSPEDKAPTKAVLDADDLRKVVFALARIESDLVRETSSNGIHLTRDRSSVSVTPVEIKTPALVR